MERRNMRVSEVTFHEFVVGRDGLLVYGNIEHDHIHEIFRVKFHHCGFSMRSPIKRATWIMLTTDNNDVKRIAQERITNMVHQFAMRAEAATRGGYD